MYFENILYLANKQIINVIEIIDGLKNEETVKINMKEHKQSIVEPGLLVHALFVHDDKAKQFSKQAIISLISPVCIYRMLEPSTSVSDLSKEEK
jgi:hypothetical protein